MRAVVFEKFGGPLRLTQLPDPTPPAHGAVLRVQATGVCRSDWHAWQGHDSSVSVPHVPGHEMAGTVVAVGSDVRRFAIDDRVTVPFICACGTCEYCQQGDQQVCPQQTQPGFTHFGSFAEYVAIDWADINLVRLPEGMESTTAASLGCRFATAFRGLVDQANVQPGQWVAVHGCGGVGLSAVMIAAALDAQVIAVDIDEAKMDLAMLLGAKMSLNGRPGLTDVSEAIKRISGGGAHISIDALGSTATAVQSLNCLRKRGTHLQIGLMLADHATPAIPFGRLVSDELRILGCHGMQAHRYPAMLELIERKSLHPEQLIGARIPLSQASQALTTMNQFPQTGVTIIDRFDQ